MSLAEVEELIGMFADGFRLKERIRWAIADPATGTMIGDLGYNNFHSRDSRAEVGYGLAPEFWRRGVMTTALGAIIDYGFSKLELNKIEATVNVDNDRSAGLLRKLGFQLEGTLRDYRNRRGRDGRRVVLRAAGVVSGLGGAWQARTTPTSDVGTAPLPL